MGQATLSKMWSETSDVQMKAWFVSHIIFGEEPLQLLILYVPQCEKT